MSLRPGEGIYFIHSTTLIAEEVAMLDMAILTHLATHAHKSSFRLQDTATTNFPLLLLTAANYCLYYNHYYPSLLIM